MSNVITNQTAYLRTSRNFSSDVSLLTTELNRTYIDIALAVNSRVIGIFSTNVSSITGEAWYITKNQKQQSLRQVYPFTSTAPIAHGLNIAEAERFTRMFGSYTNGTNWYGVIGGTSVLIPGQLSFYITANDIIFLFDGTTPPVTKGVVVIEWLSQV